MTKLEAPETPPPGTDARCTQLFGGGVGATESPPHASRHRKPRSASRGLTRIDSGRTRSRKRRRAARKVKSSRVFARASSRSKFRDHWPHPWSPFLRERKSPLLLVLRFSHVFFGALWVGMMAFQTFFLMPALAEVGPESGKFMAALMRRRLRARGAMTGWVVMILLLYALGAMAVARYL